LTDRRRPSDAPAARRSAITVAVVLAVLAAWQAYRGHPIRRDLFALVSLGLVVVAVIPSAARLFHRLWMGLAHVLGTVNSTVVLSILYFVVITPIGRLVRWTGHDPLTRRGPRAASYWITRPRTRQSRSEFERIY
jgi:hypothetical protein